ncbi:uncharacterized protein LOC111705442 [Eurytemora carolleeae]|uniref:uncharacterized protein LOC111705442 n=1 Tax=Eurytemora carolleeae TaxID=1294199 RepID=UPI000C7900E8|nr:uncharacterized protein LOC111705442 [Eurytemora carolleeae]|eukprot:XP_023333764.1 uncharacterized protein LOC111705442 [Eurytemora affinis]
MIPVPVPVPVPTPVHVLKRGKKATPTPAPHSGYASPTPATHGGYASPTPANHGGYASPTPSPQVRAPAVVVSALPRRRFKRQRQVLGSSISASDQNADLIRQLVVQLLRQRTGQTGLNQQTPQPQFNQLSQQTSFNQFDLQTPQGPPEEGRLGKALEQLSELQEEPVSPAQQAQILVDQLRQLVGSQTQAPILPPIPDSPPPPPPHSIHQAELPAPPGCRSVITQHCVKVPEKITLKVPEETCKEPLCDTVPIEECMDFLKEIPFLVAEEECKDVVRLECAEVEESVPIQVCTSIDINRDVIISSYGETYSVNGNRPLKSTSEVVAKIPIVSGVDGSERLSSKLRSGRAQKLDDSNNSESEDDSLDDSSERERGSGSRQRKNLSERRLKNFLSKLLDEDSQN